MHGKLAGFSDEEKTFDADEVAVIEKLKQFPAVDVAAELFVVNADNVVSADIELQTGNAVGEVNEGSFAHHAGWGSDASGESHRKVVELPVCRLQFFCRRTPIHWNLWFDGAKLLDDRSNRVFAALFDNLAALELVWVDIADEFAQRVEMRAARNGLIVLFDER